MIKSITVSITELDDEEIAIEQLNSQLNPDELMKNSIAVVSCHHEFIFSGIFKAVCEALPFEAVGATSSEQCVPGKCDALLMTLMILTSDELEFKSVITPSILVEPERMNQAIAESYQTACGERKPDLVLAFAPFIQLNCSEDYLTVLNEASGGVPCFGTIAVDDTADFAACATLINGEAHRDKIIMVFIYGNIKPKFFVANISDERIMSGNALVTKSAGGLLMEVNGAPFIEYFEKLGLAGAAEIQFALSYLPFLLDYNDGTPKVSRVFVALTPDKHAVCAGAVPQGATLYIASSDKNDVIKTTGEAIDEILKEMDANEYSCALMYSCITRSITLANDKYKEMELVMQTFGQKLPFMISSSGGEICPMHVISEDSKEKVVNRFHNNTLIVCLI